MRSVTDPTIFVGSYAPASAPGIHALTLRPDGTLEPLGAYAGIERPSFLALHPNGQTLYAVGETDSGTVNALRLSHNPLTFSPLSSQPSGGDWPCHLRLDRSGSWLIVSNYGSGTVEVIPILPDGALGSPVDIVQHAGNGPNPDRQDGPHAHSATFSPDGRFVVVADLGTDQLVIYQFDAQAGKLLPHGSTVARPGAGPRHMLFHPDGQRAYVANELDCTISAYAWDASAGMLTEQSHATTLPPDAPPTTVADLQLSADGLTLFVSNRGHDSIAVFDISAGLDRIALWPCGGRTPRNFAVLPDGGLLVANQESDLVSVLKPDGAAAGSIAVAAPAFVQVLP